VRDDVARAYPAYGNKHGFGQSIEAKPGTHSVCVYAINGGPGGHVQLTCTDVTVPSA
jgi:hypothetical protein